VIKYLIRESQENQRVKEELRNK